MFQCQYIMTAQMYKKIPRGAFPGDYSNLKNHIEIRLVLLGILHEVQTMLKAATKLSFFSRTIPYRIQFFFSYFPFLNI